MRQSEGQLCLRLTKVNHAMDFTYLTHLLVKDLWHHFEILQKLKWDNSSITYGRRWFKNTKHQYLVEIVDLEIALFLMFWIFE